MIAEVASGVYHKGQVWGPLRCNSLEDLRRRLTDFSRKAKDPAFVDFSLTVRFDNSLVLVLPARVPLSRAFSPGGIEGELRDVLFRTAFQGNLPEAEAAAIWSSGVWKLARQLLNQMQFSHTGNSNSSEC